MWLGGFVVLCHELARLRLTPSSLYYLKGTVVLNSWGVPLCASADSQAEGCATDCKQPHYIKQLLLAMLTYKTANLSQTVAQAILHVQMAVLTIYNWQ